jgi:molybdenum cofactor cytidylyltransferase
MGRNKMLLPYGTATVLETIVMEVTACPDVTEVVVVTGHQPDQIAALLAPYAVRCVLNPAFAQTEMLASLQVGIRALRAETQAALVVLGDQPRLQREVIHRVVAAYEPGKLVIPSYQMKRGHPSLIDRVWWDDLLALPDTATLRDFIHAHERQIRYVVVETDSVLKDLDTPQDYNELLKGQAHNARQTRPFKYSLSGNDNNTG